MSPATLASAIRRCMRGVTRTTSTVASNPGLTSVERAELIAARRRIRELESELAIHRAAAELLESDDKPKGDSRQSK